MAVDDDKTWQRGELVPTRASFSVDDVPTDPTTITVKVRNPQGVVESWEFGVDPEVVRDAVGDYHLDVLCDLVGIWRARWEGTGAAAAIDHDRWLVEEDPFAVSQLAPRALCSIDDVLLYSDPNDLGDESQDHEYTRLINAASREFHRIARREIVAYNATRDAATGQRIVAPETRFFDAAAAVTPYGDYWIGDLADLDGVSVEGRAIELVDVVALPRVREEWQPISRLRFPKTTVGRREVIAVTGTWGFPAVPEDVRQHVIETVKFWADRDLTTFGQVFVSETGAVQRNDQSLPGPAYKAAVGYRRRHGLASLPIRRT